MHNEAVVDTARPSTPPYTPASGKQTQLVTVAETGVYVPVGDYSFGGNHRIDEPLSTEDRLALAEIRANDAALTMAERLEKAAEMVLREVLEKLGLRLKRYHTWVEVMNRVRKARLEIWEYRHPENGGWHIRRNGRVAVKISYPWVTPDGQIRMRVS